MNAETPPIDDKRIAVSSPRLYGVAGQQPGYQLQIRDLPAGKRILAVYSVDGRSHYYYIDAETSALGLALQYLWENGYLDENFSSTELRAAFKAHPGLMTKVQYDIIKSIGGTRGQQLATEAIKWFRLIESGYISEIKVDHSKEKTKVTLQEEEIPLPSGTGHVTGSVYRLATLDPVYQALSQSLTSKTLEAGDHIFATYQKAGQTYQLYIDRESSAGRLALALFDELGDQAEITSTRVRLLLKKPGQQTKLLRKIAQSGGDPTEAALWLRAVEEGRITFGVKNFPRETHCTIQKAAIPITDGGKTVEVSLFNVGGSPENLVASVLTDAGMLKPGAFLVDQPFLETYVQVLQALEGAYGPEMQALSSFYVRHIHEITSPDKDKPIPIPKREQIISNLTLTASLTSEEIGRQFDEISRLAGEVLEKLETDEEREAFLRYLYIILKYVDTEKGHSVNDNFSEAGIRRAIKSAKKLTLDPALKGKYYEKVRKLYYVMERDEEADAATKGRIIGHVQAANMHETQYKGEAFHRQVAISAAEQMVRTYDATALALLERVASIPSVAITPEVGTSTLETVKFMDLPYKDYIIALKCTLVGLGVTDVSDADRSYLTGQDIIYIAEKMGAKDLIVRIEDVKALTALALAGIEGNGLQAEHLRVIRLITSGQALTRDEYELLPEIAEKLRGKKDALRAVHLLYAEKYLAAKDTDKALRDAVRRKTIMIPEGLDPEQQATLIDYGEALKRQSEVVYTLDRDNPALTILRNLGFAISLNTPIPSAVELDRTEATRDAVDPTSRGVRSATHDQVVRLSGNTVSTQLGIIKGVYQSYESAAYDRVTADLKKARAEFRALPPKKRDKEEGLALLERVLTLEKQRSEILQKMSGPSVTEELWLQFRDDAEKIVEATSWLDLIGMDMVLSARIQDIGWETGISLKVLEHIDKALAGGKKWESLSPAAGDDADTILAKMLFTKILFGINFNQEVRLNLFSALGRLMPGGTSLLAGVAAHLLEVGEVETSTGDELFTTGSVLATNIGMIISSSSMLQAGMVISSYLHSLLFRDADDTGRAYLERFTGTPAQVRDRLNIITGDDALAFKIHLEKLLAEINKLPLARKRGILKQIAEKIRLGQIKGLEIVDDNVRVKEGILVDFTSTELFDPQTHARRGESSLRNLSQLVLDAWAVMDIKSPGRKDDRPLGLALQKGMEDTFGADKKYVTYHSYKKEGVAGYFEEKFGVGRYRRVELRQKGWLDILRGPAPIYFVFYQLGQLGVGGTASAGQAAGHIFKGLAEDSERLAAVAELHLWGDLAGTLPTLEEFREACESEEWEKADLILWGNPSGAGQQGLFDNMGKLFWQITSYSMDPTVPARPIAQSVEDLIHIIGSEGDIDDKIASGAESLVKILFWGMWEMFVLYTDYYLLKNAARWTAGKVPHGMPTPLPLKPIEWGARLAQLHRLEGKFEKADAARKRAGEKPADFGWSALSRRARREHAKKYGKLWSKAWTASRDRLYKHVGGTKVVVDALSSAKRGTFEAAKKAAAKVGDILRWLRAGANRLPLVGTAIGKGKKFAAVPPEIASKYVKLRYLHEFVGFLSRIGSTIGRTINPLSYSRRDDLRREVAREMGVRPKDVTDEHLKRIFGQPRKRSAEGDDDGRLDIIDFKNPRPLLDMGKTGYFEIDLKEVRKGKFKVKKVVLRGDRRLTVFKGLVTKVAAALPQVTMLVDGIPTTMQVGKITIVDNPGIRIIQYSEDTSGVQLANIEISRERLAELVGGRLKPADQVKVITEQIRDAAKTRGEDFVAELFDFDRPSSTTPVVDRAAVDREMEGVRKARAEAQAEFLTLMEAAEGSEVGDTFRAYQENQRKLARIHGEEVVKLDKKLERLRGEMERALGAKTRDAQTIELLSWEITATGIERDRLVAEREATEDTDLLKKEIARQKAEIEKHVTEVIRRRAAKRGSRKMTEVEVMAEFKFAYLMLTGSYRVAGPQIDTIIAAHRGISSQKECSGGKTEICAGIALIEYLVSGRRSYVMGTHSYYAIRDYGKMKGIFKIFGVEVGLNEAKKGLSGAAAAKTAFSKPVTYTSLHDFMFIRMINDSLTLGDQVPIEFSRTFILDEADALILNLARTPLILSDASAGNTPRFEKLVTAAKWYRLAKVAWALAYAHAKSVDAGGEALLDTDNKPTEAGLEQLRKMGITTREQVRQVSKCLYALAKLKEGRDVYVDKVGERILIIDRTMDRMMPDNRYEGELHKAFEAMKFFVVREDTIAIQSQNSLEVLALVFEHGRLVGISGTLDNEKVRAFTEKLGMRVYSQGENVPKIDVAKLIREGKTISQYITEIESGKDGRLVLGMRLDNNGEAISPVKLVYNPDVPAEAAAVAEFLAELRRNPRQVMTFEGKPAKLEVKELRKHSEEIFVTRRAWAEAIAKRISECVKATGDPVNGQIFGDLELAILVKDILGKTYGITDVVILGHENETNDLREAVTKSSGKYGRVTLATTGRADDLRADHFFSVMTSPGETSWDRQQTEERVGRDVDSATIFFVYSLDDPIFRGDPRILRIIEQHKSEKGPNGETLDPNRPLSPALRAETIKIMDEIIDRIDKQSLRQAEEALWSSREFSKYKGRMEGIKGALDAAQTHMEVYEAFIDSWSEFLVEECFDENGKLREGWRQKLETVLARALFAQEVKLGLPPGVTPSRHDLELTIREFLFARYDLATLQHSLKGVPDVLRQQFADIRENFNREIRELTAEFRHVRVSVADMEALDSNWRDHPEQTLQLWLRGRIRSKFTGAMRALEGAIRSLEGARSTWRSNAARDFANIGKPYEKITIPFKSELPTRIYTPSLRESLGSDAWISLPGYENLVQVEYDAETDEIIVRPDLAELKTTEHRYKYDFGAELTARFGKKAKGFAGAFVDVPMTGIEFEGTTYTLDQIVEQLEKALAKRGLKVDKGITFGSRQGQEALVKLLGYLQTNPETGKVRVSIGRMGNLVVKGLFTEFPLTNLPYTQDSEKADDTTAKKTDSSYAPDFSRVTLTEALIEEFGARKMKPRDAFIGIPNEGIEVGGRVMTPWEIFETLATALREGRLASLTVAKGINFAADAQGRLALTYLLSAVQSSHKPLKIKVTKKKTRGSAVDSFTIEIHTASGMLASVGPVAPQTTATPDSRPTTRKLYIDKGGSKIDVTHLEGTSAEEPGKVMLADGEVDAYYDPEQDKVFLQEKETKVKADGTLETTPCWKPFAVTAEDVPEVEKAEEKAKTEGKPKRIYVIDQDGLKDVSDLLDTTEDNPKKIEIRDGNGLQKAKTLYAYFDYNAETGEGEVVLLSEEIDPVTRKFKEIRIRTLIKRDSDFDFEKMLERAGVRNVEAKEAFKGLTFDGIDGLTPEEIVAALKKAGLRALVVADGIDFVNDPEGQEALKELVARMNDGSFRSNRQVVITKNAEGVIVARETYRAGQADIPLKSSRAAAYDISRALGQGIGVRADLNRAFEGLPREGIVVDGQTITPQDIIDAVRSSGIRGLTVDPDINLIESPEGRQALKTFVELAKAGRLAGYREILITRENGELVVRETDPLRQQRNADIPLKPTTETTETEEVETKEETDKTEKPEETDRTEEPVKAEPERVETEPVDEAKQRKTETVKTQLGRAGITAEFAAEAGVSPQDFETLAEYFESVRSSDLDFSRHENGKEALLELVRLAKSGKLPKYVLLQLTVDGSITAIVDGLLAPPDMLGSRPQNLTRPQETTPAQTEADEAAEAPETTTESFDLAAELAKAGIDVKNADKAFEKLSGPEKKAVLEALKAAGIRKLDIARGIEFQADEPFVAQLIEALQQRGPHEQTCLRIRLNKAGRYVAEAYAPGGGVSSLGAGEADAVYQRTKKTVLATAEPANPAQVLAQPRNRRRAERAKKAALKQIDRLKKYLPEDVVAKVRAAVEAKPLHEFLALDLKELETLVKRVQLSLGLKPKHVRFSTNKGLAKVAEILRALGISEADTADFIEAVKWRRVGCIYTGERLAELKRMFPKLGEMEVNTFLTRLAELRGSKGPDKAKAAEKFFMEKLGLEDAKDPKLVKLIELASTELTKFSKAKEKALAEFKEYLAKAKKGYPDGLPSETEHLKAKAFIETLADPKDPSTRDVLGINEAEIQRMAAAVANAQNLARLADHLVLNPKEMALLGAEIESRTPTEFVERALNVKKVGLEAARRALRAKKAALEAEGKSTRDIERNIERIDSDLKKIDAYLEQAAEARKGHRAAPEEFPQLETRIKLDKTADKDVEIAPESAEETKAREERVRTEFLTALKTELEAKLGIKLKGTTPAEIEAELMELIETEDLNAIKSKYGLESLEKAAQLKAAALVLANDIAFEGCRIYVGEIDGKPAIVVETTGRDGKKHTRAFKDEAEAKVWLEIEIREGRVKISRRSLISRGKDLLKAEPMSLQHSATTVGGMMLVGAIADALVATMFETKRVLDGAIRHAQFDADDFEDFGSKRHVILAALVDAGYLGLVPTEVTEEPRAVFMNLNETRDEFIAKFKPEGLELSDEEKGRIYDTVKASQDFSFEDIGTSALHGGISWGVMGIRMQIASMLLSMIPEEKLFGKLLGGIGRNTLMCTTYAIFLPMLEEIDNPTIAIRDRAMMAVEGGFGFGVFMAVDHGVNGLLKKRYPGMKARWPGQISGALASALASQALRLGIEYSGIMDMLPYEYQEVFVESTMGLDAALETITHGQMIGGGLSFLGVTEASAAPALAAYFSLLRLNGEIWNKVVDDATGTTKYEKHLKKMAWREKREDSLMRHPRECRDNPSDFPPNRIPAGLCRGAIDLGNRWLDAWTDLGELILSERTWARTGVGPWESRAIAAETDRMLGTIMPVFASLCIATARYDKTTKKLVVDSEKIMAEINRNGDFRFMLGFLNRYNPDALPAELKVAADGTITELDGGAIFDRLLSQNPPLTLDVPKDGGGTERVSLAELHAKKLTTAVRRATHGKKAARYLAIQKAIALDKYKPTAGDRALKLVDRDGYLLPQSEEFSEEFMAVVQEIRIEMEIQTAIDSIDNSAGGMRVESVRGVGPVRTDDFYDAIIVFQELLDSGDLTRPHLDAIIAAQSQKPGNEGLADRVEEALKHAKEIEALRIEGTKIGGKIEVIEQDAPFLREVGLDGEPIEITDSDLQRRYVEVLTRGDEVLAREEELYAEAGYDIAAIQELRAARNHNRSMLRALGYGGDETEDLGPYIRPVPITERAIEAISESYRLQSTTRRMDDEAGLTGAARTDFGRGVKF
ncbi:MAG: hypothetical protein ABH823_00535 [bacterium]